MLDRNFLYIFILLLIFVIEHIHSLKCFAGDPIYQHECTSLSYCLLIISRSGRSQWSCDGNSFNQVSLCSNLGLIEDLVAGINNNQHNTAIFEHQTESSSNNKNNHGKLSDDDALAEYYRQQETSVRNSLSSPLETDHKNRLFFTENTNNKNQFVANYRGNNHFPASNYDSTVVTNGRRTGASGIRYYPGQSRCFDGGDLGRICCCSTDYCNSSRSIIFASKTWITLTTLILLINYSINCLRLY